MRKKVPGYFEERANLRLTATKVAAGGSSALRYMIFTTTIEELRAIEASSQSHSLPRSLMQEVLFEVVNNNCIDFPCRFICYCADVVCLKF